MYFFLFVSPAPKMVGLPFFLVPSCSRTEIMNNRTVSLMTNITLLSRSSLTVNEHSSVKENFIYREYLVLYFEYEK